MKHSWIAALALNTVAALAHAGGGLSRGIAPEFTHTDPDQWLNSAPLTLAALRGKVVPN